MVKINNKPPELQPCKLCGTGFVPRVFLGKVKQYCSSQCQLKWKKLHGKRGKSQQRTLTAYEAQRVKKLAAELATRRMESLRLWEPLPNQLAFHKSNAPERLVRGSNQSGKTLCHAVEVAWAALGRHPYLDLPKGNMEIYLVAKDGKQVGEVWWRKLCLPGAFEIIRDLESGEWRSYRPWDEHDQMRKHERQPAPPLIPERHWAREPIWENKGAMVPRILHLKNRTRVHFFTGNARPPHGVQVHWVGFDEEIGSQLWYSEMAARLLRFNGKFTWSATPQAATEGLYELHLRAELEAPKEKPGVTEHFLHIQNNPHIDDEAKATLLGKLTDPEQKRVRWDGEYAGSQLHIYPEWNPYVHVGALTPDGWKPLGKEGHFCSLPIPRDWTRFAVVDPGHTTCAVLFAAIPPKEQGDYVYLYDELYLQPCMNADHFAERFEQKVRDEHFYEFIVDSHGSRRTEEGSGFTTGDQYSRALAKRKVRSQVTGSSFIDGMDDVKHGNMAVHDWLCIRGDTGDAKLRVLKGHLPNFEFEIQRYRKKRKPDGTILDEPYGKFDHLMSCLRYLRGRNPKWHPAQPGKRIRKPDGLALFERLKAQAESRWGGESDSINLGPGSGRQIVGVW